MNIAIADMLPARNASPLLLLREVGVGGRGCVPAAS